MDYNTWDIVSILYLVGYVVTAVILHHKLGGLNDDVDAMLWMILTTLWPLLLSLLVARLFFERVWTPFLGPFIDHLRKFRRPT